MTTQDQRPVLVVGAGPSGLTAAVELTRRGVPVRCVDRAEGPSTSTKALGVWPRTLELLRRMGAEEEIRRRVLPQRAMRYYSDGRVIADLRFRDTDVQPVCLPQPDVESMLRDALTEAGGQVEWGTELVGFQQDGPTVKAVLRGSDGTERTEEFSWVVGADGARSRVREHLDIDFEGATHELSFVVADIELDGPLEPDVTHYFCSPRGILVTCGLPSGRFRVFTSAPPGLRRDEVDLAVVQNLVDERGPGGIELRDPDWISVFAVHSRHADRTREGRVFLLGDAAHIHSPAGGQGLNIGMADAHNLAWKLALCWHGRSDATLLDSFESERAQTARAAIKQADIQTRIWLLNKPHQVALRDNALRVASALRLFHLDYLPWLAGQRTVYTQPGSRRRRLALPAGRPWPGSGGFTEGGLVPRRQIWDIASSRRMPLRSALSDLRYTLLLHGDGTPGGRSAQLAAWVRDQCAETVEVQVMQTRTGTLRPWTPERPASPNGPDTTRIALVRPDGIADLACPARESWRVRRRLEELFAPLLKSADIPEARADAL
ncbi:FAD-dependent monooxygenase [Streptomyces sp. HNM0645]|uniref:FAD-dependent monooxygenase n=1 Tax=Streptomyces sp. HNM0645 TaxID=2782343 RepID=UPI0024B846D8|nr:FAD-dependent monooxygenase [Streptomyces sp. HNM0645]MDI9886788.1 FAD-dependent monooxygenase [Streptomyces sp. HNM0645]